MNDLGVGGVLAQIRLLSLQAGTSIKAQPATTEPVSFGAVLKNALDQATELDEKADRLATAFELGDARVDLSAVMLAGAKADIASTAIVQVRNRLVSAYQDVMNMPL